MFLILFLVVSDLTSVYSSEIAPAFYGLDRPALEYELPPLLYTFDELEPYMDEASAKMHYFEYHAKYVSDVNIVLKRWRRNTKGKHSSRMSIIEIIRNMSSIPLLYRNDLKHYGSAYINHNLFWSTISPNIHGEPRLPTGAVQKDIAEKFGSFVEFKTTFTDMASNFFGSGYVWLCRNYSSSEKSSDLFITTTTNEDTPVSQGLFPVLGLDVWEHAYILKWHNQKSKYIENWWFLIDWQQVNSLSDWWQGLKLHDEL